MAKVIKEADLNIKIVDSLKLVTLSYTDIVLNNNKCYNIEIVKSSDHRIFLFTVYGRIGGTLAREYRPCSDQLEAEAEFAKIVKSKLKKGYVEVALLKSELGSDIGKSKAEVSQVKVEDLKKIGFSISEEPTTKSKLHLEVQDLVRTWFGVTQEFVDLNLDTKKCSLGQLSIAQITKGKDILDEARKIIHASKDVQELNKLTNMYYSNIPHNLGYSRINADTLRLDDDDKINKSFDFLDIVSQAKDVEKVISKKSAVDSQYATLNSDLQYIESSEPTWKWIDSMLHETRATNHSFLGKLKTHKVYKVKRNGEENNFLKNAERIAKECGKQTPSEMCARLVKSRPDVPKELQELYKNANVLPVWHGTRRANMIGITTNGLLIRPGGNVIFSGAMYGSSLYFGNQSSKSINYVDIKGSYWAQGNNKTAYLFLVDAAFGNQKIVQNSYFYTKQNIKPFHSVWAKGSGNNSNRNGVINDELMLYEQSGPQQQHALRYIIEFETQCK